MQTFLWISIGALVGANLRYFIGQSVARLITPLFPYGTLFINVTGSFAAGFFLIWTSERVLADPRWRLLVAVGLCGGFTTFSSFAYETFALFEQGRWAASVLNVVFNNLLCIGGVIAGAVLARSI